MRAPLLFLLLPLLGAAGVCAEDDARPAKKAAWQDYAPVALLEGHESFVRCVAFSPDGKTLATGGSDRSLRLWNGITGELSAMHQLPRSG